MQPVHLYLPSTLALLHCYLLLLPSLPYLWYCQLPCLSREFLLSGTKQSLSPVRLYDFLPLLVILAIFETLLPTSKKQQNAAKLSERSNVLHSERTNCRFLQINQLKWVGGYLLPISFKSRYFYTLKIRYLLPIMSWKILRTLLKKHPLLLKITLIWNHFLNWIIHIYIESRTQYTVTPEHATSQL